MRHPRLLPTLLLLSVLPAAMAAAPTFSYKDWIVACDNTRSCQAAGFQSEGVETDPMALLLTRAAGPGTPVRATVMVQLESEQPKAVTIKVGSRSVAGIVPDQEMTVAQLASLMPGLLSEKSATVSDGKHHWTLSLAGINAALLKMDDLQGRIDTPGALVRKGAKPESAALPPVSAPLLTALPVPATADSDSKLLAPILKSLPKNDCEARSRPVSEREATLYRLSPTKVLVTQLCGRYAYQSSYEVWIANAKPPYAPEPARLPLYGKDAGNDVMEASFENGVLSSYAKGRGINDCGEAYSWLWTASGFQLQSATEAPVCRGFPGGVMLTTWQSRQR